MDLNDTPELAEYRAKVRSWLEENASEAPQRRGREDMESVAAHREWQGRLAAAGLAGEEVWCQLFSEPAAGSDLAGIQARAKRSDDGSWTVSGQKVWTTNAQHASFGLLLARTDPDVPKHRGLTMFVLPMDAEGVSV